MMMALQRMHQYRLLTHVSGVVRLAYLRMLFPDPTGAILISRVNIGKG